MEQMREGMVVLDADWRIIRLNPAAANILATSTDHTRGNRCGRFCRLSLTRNARLGEARYKPA